LISSYGFCILELLKEYQSLGDRLEYRIVRLGDYPHQPIKNFAEARNFYLNDGWILFVDNDEQASEMLLDYLDKLVPKYAYYWVRVINLCQGRFIPWMNPHLDSRLMSSQVKYSGRQAPRGYVMEGRVSPYKPHGIIDYPIIHNHPRDDWHTNISTIKKIWLRSKKMTDTMRGR